MEKKKNTDLLTVILTVLAVILAVNALVFRYTVEVIVPLIKAGLLFLNIYIYGFIILRSLKRDTLRFPSLFGIGLVFTTGYFYVMSFLHILSPFSNY